MKIKDTTTALALFEEAANEQAKATEEGNYKIGNKAYDRIVKATAFLKNENSQEALKEFLGSPSIGVRMWAAGYLLSVFEKDAICILETIAEGSDIHAFTAKTTLSEWRKGNLILW